MALIELTRKEINKIVRQYNKDGLSVDAIAINFHHDRSIITRVLKAEGVTIRGKGRSQGEATQEIRTKFEEIARLKGLNYSLSQIGEEMGTTKQAISAFYSRWEGRC